MTKGKRVIGGIARGFLYLLLIASLAASSVGIAGIAFLNGRATAIIQGKYLAGDDRVYDPAFFNTVQEDQIKNSIGKKLLHMYLNSGIKAANEYSENVGVLYAIYTSTGRRVGGNMKVADEEGATTVQYSRDQAGIYASDNIENYKLKLILLNQDYLWAEDTTYGRLERLMEGKGQIFFAAYVAGKVLAVLCAILLVRTKKKRSPMDSVPLDLVTVVAAAAAYFSYVRLTMPDANSFFAGIEWCRAVPVLTAIGALYFVHLFGRLRMENWHRNTLLYRLYRLIRWLVERWWGLVENIPLIWKMLSVTLGVSAVELAIFLRVFSQKTWAGVARGMYFFLAFWIVEKLVLLPFMLYRMLALKKIQKATEELASGHLNYKLEISDMPKTFRNFGRDLNAVADSVSLAVEDRIKSERLKTELITNVSHDIKTPLTSIVNFSDLISKEPTENAKITEYAGLLHKQSTRLKKLIEDLIEASKASTGSMEMHPEHCEVRTLLAQCLGEYEQRLQNLDIDLIVKLSQEPVWIMADTKMLWRIFENLMNNICKYTQKETRVYLTMELQADRVSIAFKNISKYPLDIEADELMERFVRGDMSRHTEGSGLGLSIVKSLVDLLQGKIELVVDGDLFKVLLEFSVVEAPVSGEIAVAAEPAVLTAEVYLDDQSENCGND